MPHWGTGTFHLPAWRLLEEPRGSLVMPRSKDATSIELPIVLRDRLVRLKRHERQACYEIVEEALDFWEDAARVERLPPAEVLS